MGTPIEVTLVAAPIVNFLIGKLATKTWKELKSLWSIDTDRLESKLSTIMSLLEGVANKPVVTESSAMYQWLNKLKDAAFDADDVINECHAEALRQKKESKASDFFSKDNTFIFTYKMNKKLKDVMKTLDEIVDDRQCFILKELYKKSESSIDQGRETSSVLTDSTIYERDEDRERIVNYLIYEDIGRKEVPVYPIVGLAGIGKTTLAQLIYNDERISEQFDSRLWIWVSTNFSVESILRKMIELITGENCNLSQIESMQQTLKRLLSGKRFLLVLDDVWNEEGQQWEHLLSHLRMGGNGRKILLTTRCLKVAAMTGSTHMHQLKGLSNNACWKIFSRRAFGMNRVEIGPRLEEIGKKIVEKCGGLPLAAESLGNLMSTQSDELGWLTIQNIEMWRLPEDRTKIFAALKLSFHFMPYDLKQRFTYCSLFPKSYKFDKEKLIALWVVEEFIPSLFGGMPEEQVKSSCFDQLLDICFLQDVDDHNLKDAFKSYKMHDVVQDLAWSVAGDEFMFVDGNKLFFKKTYSRSSHRYLSLICDSLSFDTLNNASSEIEKVRSLILLPQENITKCTLTDAHWDLLLKLGLLRVLDLSSSNISGLPHTISNLRHLRHLNLSNTEIRMLPDTIIYLYNLLTLNLSYCLKLQELPSGMSNMSNLRHLDIFSCQNLVHMPARIGRLIKLQTLTMFIIGENEDHAITQLQNMNLIKGKLQIKNLHNLKNRAEAERANLQAKKDLRQLEFNWNRECDNVEEIFEGLQPYNNVENIKINGYSGLKFPSWLSTGFCSVRELSIVNCKVSSLSSLSDRLHLLEKLEISSCEELTHLPGNIAHQYISSLRILDISDNKNLMSLGDGQVAPNLFRSIQCLKLQKCESLVELPVWFDGLTSLKSVDLCACDKLGGLHRLKSMNWMSVALCHKLADRYKLESGEDWHLDPVVVEVDEQGADQGTRTAKPKTRSRSKFRKRLGLLNQICARK